jgi:hypothetical protein
MRPPERRDVKHTAEGIKGMLLRLARIAPASELPNADHPYLDSRSPVSPLLARTIWFVWCRDRSFSPAGETFAAVLRATARS